MKRGKALIHYEIKNLLLPLAYFFVVDGFFLWQIIRSFNKDYQFFLIYGDSFGLTSSYQSYASYWLIAHFIGVLILAALSSRDRIIIPYLLLVILLIAFYLCQKTLIQDTCILSGLPQLAQLFESIPHLLFCFACDLLIITFAFSLCQCLQYLTTNLLIGASFAILICLSPLYISKLLTHLLANVLHTTNYSEQIGILYETIGKPWLWLFPSNNTIDFYSKSSLYYKYYSAISLKLSFLLVATALCFLGSYHFTQRYFFITQDQLFPSKGIRTLLLVLLILFSASIPFYLKHVIDATGFAATNYGIGAQLVAYGLITYLMWNKWLKVKTNDEKEIYSPHFIYINKRCLSHKRLYFRGSAKSMLSR